MYELFLVHPFYTNHSQITRLVFYFLLFIYLFVMTLTQTDKENLLILIKSDLILLWIVFYPPATTYLICSGGMIVSLSIVSWWINDP